MEKKRRRRRREVRDVGVLVCYVRRKRARKGRRRREKEVGRNVDDGKE